MIVDLGSCMRHDRRPAVRFERLAELAKVIDGIPGGGPHAQPVADFWPVHDAHVKRALLDGAWIPDEVLASRPSDVDGWPVSRRRDAPGR